MIDAEERERTLERIRELCLGLPETSERLSHGAPTFFVRGKRAFLMVLTDHHGDGRFAIWCAAPPGVQATLVENDSDKFFRPPYVGHRGWLGVRLDGAGFAVGKADGDRPSRGRATRTPGGLDWNELAGIVEDAFAEVAPPQLVERAAQV